MLMRTDPFGDIDRLTQRLMGNGTRPANPMPMDAYRDEDEFVVSFDLPGVRAESIDLEVEHNVVTVSAERSSAVEGRETVVCERPSGRFSRQIFLGETLNSDDISADYTDGVLTLRVPVAEQAKPRKISVTEGSGQPTQISA